MRKKAYLLFGFISVGFASLAQQLDTIQYSRQLSHFITEEMLDEFDTSLQKEDTAFYENYAIHPLRAIEPAYQDLGPVATPYYSFEQRFEVSEGFDLGFHTLDAYQSDPKKTKYYFSETPRTVLKYSQGGQDLLYLNAQHSQKISKLWSAGLDYERIKSNNIYYGNITDFTSVKIPNSFNTKLYTRFHSPNYRYHVLGNVYFDKNTLNETGGLADPEHYDTLQGREKQFFNIAHNAAAQNTIKHQGIYIKQYYQLGKYPKAIVEYDSLNRDSITKITIPPGKSVGQLYHEFNFEKNHLLFEDENPNMDYYNDLLLSTSTMDSVEHRSLSNTLGLMLHGKFSPRLALKHEFNSINQNGLMQAKFHNVSASAGAAIILSNFRVSGNWLSHFIGYNAGDQHLRFLAKINNLEMRLRISHFEPSYVSKYYLSNHFYWYNRWDKIGLQKLDVRYKLGKVLSLDLSTKNINNWIVYDKDARPIQISDNINVSTLKLNGRFSLGYFKFDTRFAFNEVSSSLVPTPRYALRQSVYYERALFKKTMPAQIGFNIYYQSEFEGMAYHPATRQFHLSEANAIGDYPVLDVFFSSHVGGLKLFAIAQHLNEGWMGDSYYSAANYPMMPFTFRFGLEWRLFD